MKKDLYNLRLTPFLSLGGLLNLYDLRLIPYFSLTLLTFAMIDS